MGEFAAKKYRWTTRWISKHIGTDVTDRETALAEINKLKSQLEKENLLLKEEIHGLELGREDIIGESDSLQYALKRATQVSGTDSTVLLEGETGVGKELFADLIHRKSKRTHRPFIKVNCSAIPKELIESEFLVMRRVRLQELLN